MNTAEMDMLWSEAGGDTLVSFAPQELQSSLGGTASAEAVLKTADGRSLLAYLSGLLREQSTAFPVSLGLLCGILLISSVWKQYRRDGTGGSGEAVSFLCTAAVGLTAFGMLDAQLRTAAAAQEQIHSAMTAAVTSITFLSAMRGSVVQAAAAQTGMGLFLSFAEIVCGGVLLPLVRLCGGMAIASVLCGNLRLDAVPAFLRKTFLFLAGGLMMLLTAVLSCQRVLAQSADSVSLRAVKFALGSAIPVIGSAVGEAAAAVGAGFSLLEKTAGTLGILIVLWQLLPPLVSVFLGKLMFSVSAAFGEILGLEKESALCREAETLASFVCAVTTCECVLYSLLLSLCMSGG